MSGGFTSRVRVEDWEPGEFVLIEPLEYVAADGTRIVVPEGFVTDFASVPGLLQALPGFDANGDSRRPAVLHDYLYCSQLLPRSRCDGLFREALVSVGVGLARAAAFYLGVRTGGWMYFGKRKQGLQPEDFATMVHFIASARTGK